MRITVMTAAALALAAAPAAAAPAATEWTIDPVHSVVEFKVRHLMVANVRGSFRKFSGTVRLDEKDPSRSSVEATIEAASIDTREAKRDEHLRSPDFFDAAKFPTITFKSKKARKTGEGKWTLTGDLTMHGVTREVTLEVEGPTPPARDPQGGTRVGVAATTKVDRRDFGLTWNAPVETGGVVVGHDVAISLELELVQKAPPAAAK